MLFAPILFALSLSSFLRPISGFSESSQGTRLSGSLPEITAGQYHQKYTKATKRLFLLDNDRVLLPPRHSEGDLNRARDVLGTLTQDRKNEVWVITARSLDTVEALYGDIRGLNLAGQFGLETNERGCVNPRLKAQTAALWSDYLKDHAEHYGLSVHVRIGSIIYNHQNRLNDGSRDFLTLMEGLHNYNAYTYRNENGMATLTHSDCNKGILATELLKKYPNKNKVFGVSMGDDLIDEPMHQALNAHGMETKLSIYVNSSPDKYTNAVARLPNHQAALDFLENLQ